MTPTPPRVWAVVVAGGSGSRFGSPKQFGLLEGREILDWSLAAAGAVAEGVVAVVPAADRDRPEGFPGAAAVVAGGDTRAASVRAGLAAVPATADIVVVHDAARPLAPASLFRDVVAAVAAGADGAVPGLAPSDTVKRVGPGGAVEATLERASLVLVQTPQAFRARALRAAHASSGEATDDATLVESAGGSVVVVPGHPYNIKVTLPSDLVLARALLAEVGR